MSEKDEYLARMTTPTTPDDLATLSGKLRYEADALEALGLRDAPAICREAAARIEALEAALEHWDRQATVWLKTRVEGAAPGWMKPAIDKGRAALKGQSR